LRKLLYSSFFILVTICYCIGQNTVGLLSFDAEKINPGYNFIYPNNQSNAYLLDNCGRVINIWEGDPDLRPGNAAYLLSDGNLLRCSRPASLLCCPIWGGGSGGRVDIISWENEILWSFQQNDSLRRLHHDVAPMPNGNILMISWELKTNEAIIEAGRDPESVLQGILWPDYIFEINPATDEIVWEWHVWDHLIQDFDSTKANFGIVSEHPELIDVNWDTNDLKADWMHSNSIDYNPVLDQVLLSVPFFNEIWIIDHSTTTAEAVSHSGGQSAKGGDLLYRWGNPMAYKSGTAEDQKLFFQHDAKWIDDFVNPSHPKYGKISVFNNRLSPELSTANILDPGFNEISWAYPESDGVFEPGDFDFTFLHPEPEKQVSSILSSVQILPNGNSLICAGRQGYTFEMTIENEVVWEYKIPLKNGLPVSQGTILIPNDNITFRLDRYPVDYPAFDDKDLIPMGFIELDPDNSICELTTIDEQNETDFRIFPNPAYRYFYVSWPEFTPSIIEIYDLLGKRISVSKIEKGINEIDITDWSSGVYILKTDLYTRKLMIRQD
jgi:hypothetical protein